MLTDIPHFDIKLLVVRVANLNSKFAFVNIESFNPNGAVPMWIIHIVYA